MELREWLIILGLALVTLIVIDGVRRLKRQRRVPRLDQVGDNNNQGNGQAAAEGDDNWELPNGGARVVRPASYTQVPAKPKLERQDHPGPSRVLSGLKSASADPRPMSSPDSGAAAATRPAASAMPEASSAAKPAEPEAPPSTQPAMAEAHERADRRGEAEAPPRPVEPEHASRVEAAAEPPARDEREGRHEPTLSALDDEAPSAVSEPLAADPADHDPHHDEDERYRLVDLEGMGDSLKDGSRRVGESVQRFGLSIQQRMAKRREQKREEKARREQARAEKAAREAEQRREAAEAQAAREAERRRLEAEAIERADDDDPLFAPPRSRAAEPAHAEPVADHAEPATVQAEPVNDDDVVRAHPTLARALRHNVNAERARDTLSQADEIIVISVLSRDEEGFSGEALLNLMLACGLRYSSDMGIFHRFETEDPDSELQFSMVNVLKPGTFPIEAMDEFRTPGITLLMPLPGALDTAAAFEAMVETAMVIVRNLGGELKDENRSVMTAQTVEFARQRVQEFERRNRLNRYQVN
ncbi:cell division protein ZipA [Billgrantia sulfidoxydans]|uniref:Cell division protein ZipA n=1 Tax=Billgrantia sulfidoxydans TaxID=2733484 RepID=A0ABX7W450_9GAMM|nr:cell division protein ZipA [Halomonas sulfidoxydans]QTP53729.1 cell division protein ZipA [Halomonas sulfidoxydans]